MKDGVVVTGDMAVLEALAKFDANTVRKAANRAINDAGKKAANAAIKEVKKVYNVTNDSWLKKRLKFQLSNPSTLKYTVVINFVDKGSLRAFEKGQKGIKIKDRYGVKVKIKRSESGYKSIHRGFIMKSKGNMFVLQRVGPKKKDLRPATTLPPLGMMMQEKGINIFQEVAQETFDKRFEHHLKFYLEIKK
ncbi:MAG: phage tail protein [Campylobacteraceae bacterium]|jgi:hypothetical protein|nr:phage tail protein [Campylobacteraceae bacterium]